MRAIIVDDEAPARRRLRGVLQQIPAVTRIDECANGRDVALLLKRGAPDLVFLDIQMPDLDGFAVAAAASEERPPAIVRSEEHTSELQSPYDLVCRLLLKKKNILPPCARIS